MLLVVDVVVVRLLVMVPQTRWEALAAWEVGDKLAEDLSKDVVLLARLHLGYNKKVGE